MANKNLVWLDENNKIQFDQKLIDEWYISSIPDENRKLIDAENYFNPSLETLGIVLKSWEHMQEYCGVKNECEYCGSINCNYNCDESQAGGFNK